MATNSSFDSLSVHSFFNNRTTGLSNFFHKILNGIDLEENDKKLGSVQITELFKGEAEPIIKGPYYLHRNSDTRIFLELVNIAYIMQVLKPERVFEFGTFVGRMTRLMAMNAPASTKIFTLDLPQKEVLHTIGEAFKDTEENHKITQLNGNSATFDFSPWYHSCDFVWIDACHDYQFVKSDTEQALKIVKPGGWIAWHDYRQSKNFDGVTKCVREFSRKYPQIHHLHGTTMAILKLQDKIKET